MNVSTEEGAVGTQVSSADLKQITVDVVRQAMQGGATAAEAVAVDGSEFSTTVRLGQTETLKESGSKGTASTYSSDLTPEGLRTMVDGALHLAKVTSEDPLSGIPAPEEQGAVEGDLELYNDDVYSLSTADRIDYARRAEKAAMSADARITNSDGGNFDASIYWRIRMGL
jgi:PmbA protein